MIIGNNVNAVQRVSRYCLKHGTEVFPYYEIPKAEELTLFAPEVLILCYPVMATALLQHGRPCIVWSEQPISTNLPLASTATQLEAQLEAVR